MLQDMESHDHPQEDEQPEELPAPQHLRNTNHQRMNDVFDTVKNKEQNDACDLCGAEVEEFVLCPNGKEICRECFDAGQC